MDKILIVNTGSASKKYALYSADSSTAKELFKIHFEKENGKIVTTVKISEQSQKLTVSRAEYDSSIEYILRIMIKNGVIDDKNEIAAAGVRIVAPGNYFLANKIIDEEYLGKLKEARQQAPLHLKPAMSEIEQLKKTMGGVPMVGISDSAFHANLPAHSRLYNLPEDLASKYGIYRFGYHGIAAQSVVAKIKNTMGTVPSKTIICHLGSGLSIHAVKNGASFDTSMGFTPLEGATMGTRIGNIDAGAVLYLVQKGDLNPAEWEDYFNTKCGLLALSGKTPDVRELIELEKGGDQKAKLALDAFAYSVRKYIGAYTAAMNGLNLLVFTATIGERSSIMRNKICEELTNIGIKLDQNKNNQTVSADGFIGNENAPVKVAVFTADEMGQMAKETAALSIFSVKL